MNFFIRFALLYLAIVCVLCWLRDDPVAAGSVLFTALFAWGVKRGWVGKILRSAYGHLKSSMKTTSESDDRDDSRELLSQWNRFIDGAQVRPQQFYSVLEEKLNARRIPKIHSTRMYLNEAGPFSAKREYLQLHRKDLDFYICGAPFGTGFFVSSRLMKQNGLTLSQRIVAVLLYLLIVALLVKTLGLTAVAIIIALAVSGAIYFAITRAGTCYEQDLAETFKQAVHNSVLEAIDELMTVRPIAGPIVRPSMPLMAELFS